jgi:hypothetical protein
MKTDKLTLQHEAPDLLDGFNFLPADGAHCRGRGFDTWFAFRRYGASRAGEIEVRTRPAVADLHLLVTQPGNTPEVLNEREAFTDRHGVARLKDLLADLPCKVQALPAIEEPVWQDESEEDAVPAAERQYFELAARRAQAVEDIFNVPTLEPRSWSWPHPALTLTLADMGFGEPWLAAQTGDGSLAGKVARIDLGPVTVDIPLAPLESAPGMLGGARRVELTVEQARSAEISRIEIVEPAPEE